MFFFAKAPSRKGAKKRRKGEREKGRKGEGEKGRNQIDVFLTRAVFILGSEI
jgi:hypothetical protein